MSPRFADPPQEYQCRPKFTRFANPLIVYKRRDREDPNTTAPTLLHTPSGNASQSPKFAFTLSAISILTSHQEPTLVNV